MLDWYPFLDSSGGEGRHHLTFLLTEGFLRRYIDSFEVDEVASALRSLQLSDKALRMVRAHATAPNRAMSRLELARTVGGTRPHTCNGVYGHFGKALAAALDPLLADEWKPREGDKKQGGGDWVVFLNRGPSRWTPPAPEEGDAWVFVMRETLARALALAGIAPYRELDGQAQAAIAAYEDDRKRGNVDDDEYEDEDEDLDEEFFAPADPLEDIECASDELSVVDDTEREAIVRARVGQGQFRRDVIERWDRQCAVTGADFLPALVASHIKPWIDSSNADRLDPANGLLLVGTMDRLFDAGFISFDYTGRIVISPEVPTVSYVTLGLSPDLRLRQLPADSRGFLHDHLSDYFRS